jgi:hypothetical protein
MKQDGPAASAADERASDQDVRRDLETMSTSELRQLLFEVEQVMLVRGLRPDRFF